MPGPRVAVLLSVVLAGCGFTDGVSAQALISCERTEDCPGAMRCVPLIQRCVSLEAEADPPRLLGEVSLTPRSGKAGQTFTLELKVNEPLHAPPVVKVNFGFGERLSEFTLAEERPDGSYRFTYTAQGDEPEGPARVSIDLIDRLGNRSQPVSDLSFIIDFTPPRPSAATLSLQPEIGCAADTLNVQALGKLVHGRVSFSLTEPVAVMPRLTADPPWLDISPVADTGAVSFDLRLKDSAPKEERPIALTAWLEDAVGNSAEALLAVTPALRVDNDPPRPPDVDTPNRWVYWRVPHGADSAQGVTPPSSYWVDIAEGEVPAGHTIRVYDSVYRQPAAPPLLADGGATRLGLFPFDRPTIAAQVIDSACNPSALKRVRDQHVVHRPVGPTGPDNPHLVEWAPKVNASYLAERVVEVLDPLAGVRVRPAESFIFERHRNTPYTLRNASLAYDASRSRVVAFGGETTLSSNSNELWEWNGSAWRQIVTPNAPSERHSGTLIFDPLRQTLVAFSGHTKDLSIWEWRGSTWAEHASAGSGLVGNTRPVAYFDGRRVTYCPLEGQPFFVHWDGQQLTKTSPPPEHPRLATMRTTSAAYDPARGVSVITGVDVVDGAPTTWEWLADGGFRNMGVAGLTSPAIRQAVYFGARGSVARLGGTQLLEWSGNAWEPFATIGSSCAGISLAVDELRAELVIVGTGAPSFLTCTVSVGGAVRVHQPLLAPPARSAAALVELPGRTELLLHGGFGRNGVMNDSWLYGDGGWSALTTGPDSHGHDLVPFGDGGALLVGGKNDVGPLPSTWVYRNGAWATLASAPAWGVGARGAALPDGGVVAASELGTWRFNGVGWSRVGEAPPLAAFRLGTLPSSDRVFALSSRRQGSMVSEQDSMLYELVGNQWVRATTPTRISRREGAALVPNFTQGSVGLLAAGGFVREVSGLHGPDSVTMVWLDGGLSNFEFRVLNNDDMSPSPFPMYEHASAYSRARQATLLFGGVTDFSVIPPPNNEAFWIRTNDSPELVARFDVSQSVMLEPGVQASEVLIHGTIGCRGREASGCVLEVFRNHRWEPVGATSSAEPARFTVAAPKGDVFSLGRSLGFRARSLGGTDYQQGAPIELRDVEAEIAFRLPPR